MNIILKNAVANDYIEKIDVTSAKLQRIEVKGESSVVGTQSSYTATGHYDDGSQSDLTELAAWSVDKTNYAAVDKGNLTVLPAAAAAQEITLKAVYDGIEGSLSVSVTYDLGLRSDVKTMLKKTTKSLTDDQKLAFNAFIQGLEDNAIAPLKLYIPAMAGNLSETFVNYADTSGSYPSDATPSSSYFSLSEKGLKNISSELNVADLYIAGMSSLMPSDFHWLFFPSEIAEYGTDYPELCDVNAVFFPSYERILDAGKVIPSWSNHRFAENHNVEWSPSRPEMASFENTLSLKGWSIKERTGNQYWTYSPEKKTIETTTSSEFNFPDINIPDSINVAGYRSEFMKKHTALLSIGTGLTDSQVTKYNELATALLKSLGAVE
jgi:hypothetical protein